MQAIHLYTTRNSEQLRPQEPYKRVDMPRQLAYPDSPPGTDAPLQEWDGELFCSEVLYPPPPTHENPRVATPRHPDADYHYPVPVACPEPPPRRPSLLLSGSGSPHTTSATSSPVQTRASSVSSFTGFERHSVHDRSPSLVESLAPPPSPPLTDSAASFPSPGSPFHASRRRDSAMIDSSLFQAPTCPPSPQAISTSEASRSDSPAPEASYTSCQFGEPLPIVPSHEPELAPSRRRHPEFYFNGGMVTLLVSALSCC
jgi:hypothetical protein